MSALLLNLLGIAVFAAHAGPACLLQNSSSFSKGLNAIKAVKDKVDQDARQAETLAKVKTAYCRRAKSFSSEEINEFLNAKNKKPDVLKAAFHQLAKKDFPPECADARCAAKTVFGDIGDKLLFMLLRFGYNGSHFQEPDLLPFESAELDDVLLALSSFPDGFLPFEKNSPLVKYKLGTVRPEALADEKKLKETGEDGGIFADARITLYEKWFKEGPATREAYLFHEIAHRVDFFYNHDSRSKEWLEFSKESESASSWGERNSTEDFAETVVLYRYNPEALIALNRKKYNFIKTKIFGGVEFTDGLKCSAGYDDSVKKREARLKADEEGFVAWFLKYQETYVPNSSHEERVKNFCSTEFGQHQNKKTALVNESSELWQCIARVHSHTVFVRGVAEYIKNKEHHELLKARLRSKKEISEVLLSKRLIQKEVDRITPKF